MAATDEKRLISRKTFKRASVWPCALAKVGQRKPTRPLLIALAGMSSRFLLIDLELLRNCERNWFRLSYATAGSHCVDSVGSGLGGACCGERHDGGATTRRR